MTFRSQIMLGSIVLSLAWLPVQTNAATALDDATIFAIFDEANSADIWTGRLGVKYGHSVEVRQLGKMVVTDHVAVQQLGRDLAKKLGIVPVPPEKDQSAQELADSVERLQTNSGEDFDRAYLHHEILFHQSVINAIKTTLLPAVQHDELKQLIKKVLPGFEHHLAATKAVAVKLGMAHKE